MKVYVVYNITYEEHPEMTGAVGPLGERAYLAAFTDSEKMLDKFMAYRKKKVFKIKKYKMSKSEFTRFRNQNAQREIINFDLTTRDPEDTTHVIECTVPMTAAEHNLIEDMSQTFGCQHVNFHDCRVFAKKYVKALSALEYPNIQRFMISYAESCGLDYDLPNAFFDELAGFAALNIGDFKA